MNFLKNNTIYFLDKGATFSDYEVLNSCTMINSVITSLPTVVVYFPYFELMDNLNIKELESVRKNMTRHATDADLLNTYLENVCWRDFKGMMFDNLRISRLMTKNKHKYRLNKQYKKLVGGQRVGENLEMLGLFTGLRNSETIERKKKNQEQRRKFRKEMSLKLPGLRSSKNFVEINKALTSRRGGASGRRKYTDQSKDGFSSYRSRFGDSSMSKMKRKLRMRTEGNEDKY